MTEKHPAFLEDYNLAPSSEASFFHVIPAPYEKTVSYGRGAALGPDAVLRASSKLELFDCFSQPSDLGIFTQPPIDCARDENACLEEIRARVGGVLKAGKFPIMLGGEHTVSVGAFRALRDNFYDCGVVQFDAHSDLRDTYFGGSLSHACVMRRGLDLGLRIFQIGVRSLSLEEHVLRNESPSVGFLDAAEIHARGVPEKLLPDDFPPRIYVTFDVDGLDPSIIPATGTPEPGGLSWQHAMTMLEMLSREREIVGADFVELAPVAGLHASDFAVARLAYNFMGLMARKRR